MSIFTVLCLSACTRGLVPPGNYSPVGKEVQTDLFGCWTKLELIGEEDDKDKEQYAGELIAVHMDSLFLLMLDNSLHVIPTSEIEKLKLVHYKYGPGNLYLYGAGMFLPNLLGMVIHMDYASGFFSLYLPVAASAGIGTLINYTSYKILSYPGPHLSKSELTKYARFPQGLPATIRLEDLESKPIWLNNRKSYE